MAHPSYFYGDPAEALDRIRAERKQQEKQEAQQEQRRLRDKKRRIKAYLKGKR